MSKTKQKQESRVLSRIKDLAFFLKAFSRPPARTLVISFYGDEEILGNQTQDYQSWETKRIPHNSELGPLPLQRILPTVYEQAGNKS